MHVDPEVHPQNEDYWGHVNPIGPRACYDEGKRVAETMCYAYMKQVGLFDIIHDIQWALGSRTYQKANKSMYEANSRTDFVRTGEQIFH